MSVFTKLLRAGEGRKVKALQDIVPEINELEPEMKDLPIEACMTVWNVVPEALIDDIGAFVRRSLHLDPNERATAEELLSDPWLADAE